MMYRDLFDRFFGYPGRIDHYGYRGAPNLARRFEQAPSALAQ